MTAGEALLLIGLWWFSDFLNRRQLERDLCRWEDDGGPPAPEDD